MANYSKINSVKYVILSSSTNRNTTDCYDIHCIMNGNPTDLDPRVQTTYVNFSETEVERIIASPQTNLDNRVLDQHSDVSKVAGAYAQISPVTVQLKSKLKFPMGRYPVGCLRVEPTISVIGELTFKPDKSNATISISQNPDEMEASFEKELFNNTKFEMEGYKPSISVLGVKQTMDFTKGSTPISLASKAQFSLPKVNLEGLEVELNITVEAEYTLDIDMSCIKDQFLRPGLEITAAVVAALKAADLAAIAGDLAPALVAALAL